MTEVKESIETQGELEKQPGKFMKWLPLGTFILGFIDFGLAAAISAGSYAVPEDAITILGTPAFFLYPIVLGGWYMAKPYKKGRKLAFWGLLFGGFAILVTVTGM